MKKETRQFVIYSRKSKFTGKGESIENQIELCRQYIAVHFSQEEADAAPVYEDEGFSGGNLERPQFKKMMKDSQKTKFAAIVVYRLDRISRNIGDFAKLIEYLGDRHIDFISIREQFDTSSPMGRAMMYIASVFSQLERETIAERIRDNMHELSKTGRWLGGTTPTGYESESISNVTVDGKVRKACKLKIIPEEISLVQLIFEKFLETGSLTKVDAFLLEKRYTTKRGKNFTRFAIKGILTNPVYMIADEAAYGYLTENHVELFAEKSDFDGKHGIMAYNRTLQRPGKAHQIRPMEEWIVSVGKHPGVIPGQQWIQVQSMLEVNKSKSYRRPRSNVALLSGLLVCGDCGDYMRPKLTNRHAANGELIYTYMCSTKERSQSSRCQIKNANGNTLDAKVISEIKKLSEDSSFFADFLAQTKKAISGNREGYDAELLTLKEKLAENESSIKALVSSLTKSAGTSAEPYIMEQIQELHQTGEDMKNRLAELETLTEHQRFADQEFAFSRQMIESFAANVDDRTVEEKRRLLRAIVKKVVWDGENAWVYLFAGDGEADLPPFDAPEVPLGEDSECYSLSDAFMVPNQSPRSRKEPKWHIPVHVSENICILYSTSDCYVRYAPMYIHSFRLIAPRKLLEAQLINQQYQNYEDLPTVQDRLRWCRHHKGLMQKEVAELTGISRSEYSDMENGAVDYYPKEIADKLAAFYEIPVYDLPDDYSLFQHKGQGKMIREYRESLGMEKKLFAQLLGIDPNLLRAWEADRKRISFNSWNKYLKNIIIFQIKAGEQNLYGDCSPAFFFAVSIIEFNSCSFCLNGQLSLLIY